MLARPTPVRRVGFAESFQFEGSVEPVSLDSIIDLQLPRTSGVGPLSTTSLDRMRPFAAGLFRSLWDVHLHHTHRLPLDGPAILAPNHIATMDGPLVVLFTPGTLALAKSELFESKAAPLLRASGQISLSRDYPDVTALRTAVSVLRQGMRLAIFPEGRRGNGDFAEIKGGVAWLAMVTGAPIIPVAIFGTRREGTDPKKALPRPGARIDVVYGGAIRVEQCAWPRRRQEIGELTEQVRGHLVEHQRFAAKLVGRPLELRPNS